MASRTDTNEPRSGDATPRGDAPVRGDELRRAIQFSYIAGAVWSCGNALSSGMLLTFLAQELGAGGKQIAYLQVAPALFGLLRLFTPLAIAGLRGTKRTCLLLSAIAYALLFAVPAAIGLGRDPATRGYALAALIGIFCVHQLLEQVATVALWTWLTDLVPRRMRGRFFSRRNMLQLVVIIPTLLLSGEYVDRAIAADRAATGDTAASNASYAAAHYGTLIIVGAVLLCASLAPLALVPVARTSGSSTTSGTVRSGSNRSRLAARSLLASLYEPAARRLLLYGCWFSFFNGLFSIAQNIYPKGILKLGLADINRMQTAMRVGQIGVSAWAGPWSDRRGNRSVLVICQLLVGAAPLFYFIASRQNPYWLYGAWLLWSAYAGINICRPNLTLRLAPRDERPAHLATFDAVTSLFLVAGTLLGGYAFDALGRDYALALFGRTFDKFELFFLGALVMRSAGAAIVATVPEPNVDLRSSATARE